MFTHTQSRDFMSSRYRQLVFYPAQPQASLPPASLAKSLTSLGLIGEPVCADWPHRYYIGDKFLQYLNFMGCAPAVEFIPANSHQPDWSSFTYIYITAQLQLVRCLIDTMMAKPVCPNCGKRHACHAQDTEFLSEQLRCPKCQQSAPLAEWDWREFGGCARQFVSVVNVYPKEAIPADSLLQQMSTQTQLSWRFFYINEALQDETN